MRKLNPLREKRDKNAAYAATFPRRKKRDRRRARKARVIAREAAWLVRHGIERNKEHPLA